MSSAGIAFSKSKPLTVGVELELQLIDPESFDLVPRSIEVLDKIGTCKSIKPEIFQSMIEVVSDPHESIYGLHIDIMNSLKKLKKACDELNILVACSGTHPFAKYADRKKYPSSRYEELIDRNQFIARRLMIFGMHVHVGLESGDMCIDVMNEFQYELPLLLGFSASSPFWQGLDTGLASSRITMFESIPTGGHICQISSWSDYQDLIAALKLSRSINSPKDIWWDVRPSPALGTLEFRVCDGMPTVEENMAMASFIHCLVSYYRDKILSGHKRELMTDWQLRENKWRAARYGVDAELIISRNGQTIDFRSAYAKIKNEISAHIVKFKYQNYFNLIDKILAEGSSYQIQRRVYEENLEPKDIVRYLVNKFSNSMNREVKLYQPGADS